MHGHVTLSRVLKAGHLAVPVVPGLPCYSPEADGGSPQLAQEGALAGKQAANTESHTPNAQATSALRTKRVQKSESDSVAPSWLCSVDALMMAAGAEDTAEAASETDPVSLSTNGHRLSLSIVTDTDIADECQSYSYFADGSLSSSLPFPLTRGGGGPQNKAYPVHCVVVRPRRSGTPASLCTEIVHTDTTAVSEAMTAESRITNASVHHPSTANTANRLRQTRTRAWMTSVPQNHRRASPGAVTPLAETPVLEDLVAPTSRAAQRCHRALSWGATERSESVIEEDIQCEEKSPKTHPHQKGAVTPTPLSK